MRRASTAFTRYCLIAASALALAACGFQGTDTVQDDGAEQVEPAASDNLADSMSSNDYGDRADRELDIADSEERPVMQAQVMLDRIGFGPGVIDGKMGMSTRNALEGFQEANDLETTGELDEATKAVLMEGTQYAATRVVRIPEDWGSTAYEALPEDPAEQAELKKLGYETLDERLAERFHTTVATLEMLNPDGRPTGMAADASVGGDAPQGMAARVEDSDAAGSDEPRPIFKPGQLVRVPNIGGDRIAPGSVDNRDWQTTLTSLGVGSDQPDVDRVVVSKAGKTLKAYSGDRLVAVFTVSSGSSEFPLPLGNWKILGKAYNPPYSYDPEVLGKDGASDETYQLPPGPNSPVGVIWIDLSKEHYGIHGTPDPETIGRAQSSGCVRLTNWDAARLAQMVSQSTKVGFVA